VLGVVFTISLPDRQDRRDGQEKAALVGDDPKGSKPLAESGSRKTWPRSFVDRARIGS
jgi:hypothetical protein